MKTSILGADLLPAVKLRNQGFDIRRDRRLTQVVFHKAEFVGPLALVSVETLLAHLPDEELAGVDFPDDLGLGFGAVAGCSAEDIVMSLVLEEIGSGGGV